ncbi:FG-GAP repeat domain-containing protein [Streptomyces sp. NPDC056399]|uniref:FG-GAP repeat domain-containing protein n=1 Tax=Streptomyces sp. NPDC056399 TaxID=3345807 RepID=UPI0035E10854
MGPACPTPLTGHYAVQGGATAGPISSPPTSGATSGSTRARAPRPSPPRKKIGFGWGVYHQLTATGNIAGAKAGDLVARDKDGALWLYLGNGDGTFAQRIKVGGGWNEYSHIVGTGDANKDGRPDLYATHGPNRTAYFYAGTGNWRTPLREPLVHRSARRQSLRDRVRPSFLTRVGVPR